jgi:hypothetical protein
MKAVLPILILISIGAHSQQVKYLDKNKVKARINTSNDKFWNINGNGAASYEVPVGQGRHPMFANSIWIGGLDPGGQIHMAANTYKQSGRDVWAGPLDTTNIASFNNTATAVYNRLWKIDCNDINNFVTAYHNGSIAAGTYTIPPDLLAYPAKGILNFQKNMAAFKDANNDGLYNPITDGDYPLIKGHQQILSIYNDKFATHGESQAAPMGIEIHERSYAYSDPTITDSMQAINYSTFYHYTIYNRSNVGYHDVYISDWSDVDLGYYMDDYIGSDTVNNFAYCYNANPTDPTGLGVLGYGNKPPVSSHAILPIDCSADGIDNNQNGIIDESGEQFKMNKVTYYGNNISSTPPAMTNPTSTLNYYSYMNGYWKDYTPFTYGGNGYGGTVPVNHVYPGDPSTNTGWTETSAGNSPGDRRLLLTSGPFNFPAKSKIEWGYAIVFSQDTSMAVNTITQFSKRVQRDVRNVKYYHQLHNTPQCAPPVYSTVGLRENEHKLEGLIYPNPANDNVTIDLNENVNAANVILYDLPGEIISESKISNGYRAKIDVRNLAGGIYFVEIKSGDRKQVYKFVKQ